jgi:hypothetical protein
MVLSGNDHTVPQFVAGVESDQRNPTIDPDNDLLHTSRADFLPRFGVKKRHLFRQQIASGQCLVGYWAPRGQPAARSRTEPRPIRGERPAARGFCSEAHPDDPAKPMCSAAGEEPLLPNYGKRRNSFAFPATYDGQTVQFVVNGEWTGLESTDIGRLPELGALGARERVPRTDEVRGDRPTAPAAAFTEPCEDTPRGCRLT